MKRLTLTSVMVILFVFSGSVTLCEVPQASIEGTWLGTMKIPSGPELRLVLDIETRSDGMLAADLTSIEREGVSQ